MVQTSATSQEVVPENPLEPPAPAELRGLAWSGWCLRSHLHNRSHYFIHTNSCLISTQQNYCSTCSARWTVIRKTVAENFSLFREHELANSGQQVKAKEKE
ncbi:unnamed protein product [Pocillopora meandrina]|uniref:Uncharacterized protein n=1 Tax=Pocillopora meandrina TaxID=46732 RepID=A0AAU9XGH5_9CNID|nr:unnamed protein product [Pocillopora meandrina]